MWNATRKISWEHSFSAQRGTVFSRKFNEHVLLIVTKCKCAWYPLSTRLRSAALDTPTSSPLPILGPMHRIPVYRLYRKAKAWEEFQIQIFSLFLLRFSSFLNFFYFSFFFFDEAANDPAARGRPPTELNRKGWNNPHGDRLSPLLSRRHEILGAWWNDMHPLQNCLPVS